MMHKVENWHSISELKLEKPGKQVSLKQTIADATVTARDFNLSIFQYIVD